MTVSLFYLLNGVFEINFVCSLAWLLLSSVLLPLALSGVETAWRRPLVFLGSGGWARYSVNPPSSGKLWAIRVFNLVCCGIVPAVIINAKEEAKAKKEHILEKVKNSWKAHFTATWREFGSKRVMKKQNLFNMHQQVYNKTSLREAYVNP